MFFRNAAISTLVFTLTLATTYEASASTQAQALVEAVNDAPRPVNTLTLNPFALIYSTVSLSYERVLTPSTSIIVNPAVTFPFTNGLELHGVGAAVGTRWYIADNAPKGFFLSPQLEYNYYWNANDQALTTLAGKGMFGHHWLIGNKVSVLWAGGVQYMSIGGTRSSGRRFMVHEGFLPTMEFGVGSAF